MCVTTAGGSISRAVVSISRVDGNLNVNGGRAYLPSCVSANTELSSPSHDYYPSLPWGGIAIGRDGPVVAKKHEKRPFQNNDR